MKNFKRAMLIMLALVMVMGCFAGCSKDDKTAKTAKVIEIDLTEEEYAFGVVKSDAQLLTDTNAFIKEIMDNGKFDEICDKYFGDGTPTPVESAQEDASKDQLVVATNAAFEPFEYKEGDKYLGIDMEIAKLLADKLGKELVIKNMDFDAVCLSVGQEKADIAMAGLTVKPDREEYVTFSESYYIASQRIIVKEGDDTFADCKTVEDVEKILNGFDSKVKIGVQNGTTGQLYCEGDEDWGFDGLKVTTKGYKNGSLAVQDMLNGNIDYVIIDSAPASCITEAINAVA